MIWIDWFVCINENAPFYFFLSLISDCYQKEKQGMASIHKEIFLSFVHFMFFSVHREVSPIFFFDNLGVLKSPVPFSFQFLWIVF